MTNDKRKMNYIVILEGSLRVLATAVPTTAKIPAG